jgi:hypothetical protein
METRKHAKRPKHFCKDYIITDRVLGAGAHGRVHMAIEQFQRKQLACKIVDLRKLQPPNRMSNVNSRLQLVKVKSWDQKQKKDNRLEEKLKTYYREADILASLNHVSCSLIQHSSSVVDSRAAKHNQSRESILHRQ